MQRQYLTTKEAALYLGMSESWLNQRRMAGKQPAYHKVGRLVRYTTEDLDRWVRSNRKGGKDE